MYTITVKGNFDKTRLERMREEEIGIYHKAVRNLEGLEDTMIKNFAPMLIKKGFDVAAVNESLKPFYKGYDFDFDVVDDGVKIKWDGHYWIDYKDEMIICAMYNAFKMFKPFWWLPNIIREKLNAIRDPKKMFLPKLNEPTVRERHMKDLLEEITTRFRKQDENCTVTGMYKEAK